MKWSFTIGRVGETEIRLHSSLILIIPLVLIQFQPATVGSALWALGIVAAVLACIVLHELGHTMAARANHIHVSSITLWPLGGFARLAREAEKPLPAMMIAAAGPAVNLVLFGLIFILALGGAFLGLFSREVLRTDYPLLVFFTALGLANLSLAVFNLLPIYPLDGGRVARAILQLLLGESRADKIIQITSLALALGLLGFSIAKSDIQLILISLFLLAGSWGLVASKMTPGSFLYNLRHPKADPIDRTTKAIKANPKNSGLYIKRAIAYILAQEYYHAMIDLERAQELDPENVLIYGLRSDLFYFTGRHYEALECCETMIRLKPDFAVSYANRGMNYRELGNFEQALSDLDLAINMAPNFAISYAARSMIHYRLGDRQSATADADRAQRLRSNNGLFQGEISLSVLKGNLDWAIEFYGRAIQQQSDLFIHYEGRADAYRVNGRFTEAIADYGRAIRLAPQRAELYLNLGRVYQLSGEEVKAEAYYLQALEHSTQPHITRQAKRLLCGLSRRK